MSITATPTLVSVRTQQRPQRPLFEVSTWRPFAIGAALDYVEAQDLQRVSTEETPEGLIVWAQPAGAERRKL